MTEIESMIFEMIDKGYNLNDIAYELFLSSKQVHQKILKLINDGYFIRPIYFDDGNIRYEFLKEENEHTRGIRLCDSSKFKALVISDIHIGNILENLSYLYKVYDYALDNDFHIIFNCGDLIDGTFSKGEQYSKNIDEQIQKVINDYPYNRHVLNFICLGNHDYSASFQGRNINKALFNHRPDLITLGYGFSLINLLKDQIVLYHSLDGANFKPIPNKLILEGHHHKMMSRINKNNFIINVPPLSDLCFGGQENPSFLEMKLTFGGNYINSGFFKHIGFKNGFENLGEIYLEFFLKHENLDEKKLILK